MASRLALGPTQHLKGYLKGSFLRSKAGREWSGPFTSIKCCGQECWSCNTIPLCPSWHCYSLIEHRNNFISPPHLASPSQSQAQEAYWHTWVSHDTSFSCYHYTAVRSSVSYKWTKYGIPLGTLRGCHYISIQTQNSKLKSEIL
jgi:hypothetical protein